MLEISEKTNDIQNNLLKTKTMQYNFDMIIPKLIDSFEYLDVDKTNHVLSNIKDNCICMGTGGSYSVSLFASIVLDNTNEILTVAKEPRDILYTNLSGRWKYLLGITYGNKNYGIRKAEIKAREKKLSTHLLTINSDDIEDICYKGAITKEHSFISLASTVVPMSILLNYYLKNTGIDILGLIKQMYLNASNIEFNLVDELGIPLFEIMSGDNTYVASKVLESTIVEAGLGIPVVHEKYSFCHGRSTLSHNHKNSNLIYLVNGNFKELDKELLLEATSLYKNIIILNSKEDDFLIGELDLVLQSLFLCKSIAEKQNKDLSKVEHSGVVKKLYYYKGGM